MTSPNWGTTKRQMLDNSGLRMESKSQWTKIEILLRVLRTNPCEAIFTNWVICNHLTRVLCQSFPKRVNKEVQICHQNKCLSMLIPHLLLPLHKNHYWDLTLIVVKEGHGILLNVNQQDSQTYRESARQSSPLLNQPQMLAWFKLFALHALLRFMLQLTPIFTAAQYVPHPKSIQNGFQCCWNIWNCGKRKTDLEKPCFQQSGFNRVMLTVHATSAHFRSSFLFLEINSFSRNFWWRGAKCPGKHSLCTSPRYPNVF